MMMLRAKVAQRVGVVHRQAVLGASGGLFPDCTGRMLRVRHDARAKLRPPPCRCRRGASSQAPPHVPFEVVGQHAEEDVRPHPLRQPVVHRAHVRVDRLDGPEGSLRAGKRFVTLHRCRVVAGRRRAGWCVPRKGHQWPPRRRSRSSSWRCCRPCRCFRARSAWPSCGH
jgi:hypothetical protein